MSKPEPLLREFKETLLSIRENDVNYDVRLGLVYKAMGLAHQLGYPVGVRVDPVDGPAWPVHCIMLPGIGEISWHCPAFEGKYNGYSVEEKYARIALFANVSWDTQ